MWKGLLLATLVVAAPSPAQFLPPGVLNPGAGADGGADLFADQVFDSGGVLHVVWASQNDYTGGADGDPDIFYASFDGAWSPVELVNSYGNTDGGADERNPRIAVGGGNVYVVWQSRSGFAGAGSDWDVFAAQRSGSTWSTAQVVTAGNGWDDLYPNVAVRPGGDVLVVWEGLRHQAAVDRDILYSLRAAGVSSWPAPVALNSNAVGDSGDDLGPIALAITEDGAFVAAWSTDDDFRSILPVGPDRDIVWSMLPPPPAGSWLEITEVATTARGDFGPDTLPAVAALGSGLDLELHFAWTRYEDGDGDIHHTVVRFPAVDPPANDSWPANSNSAADGALDLAPSLCFDSGDVLHLVWQSEFDALTNTDPDIFHATNATPGNAWSDLGVLGLFGFLDGLADDLEPRVACTHGSVLSATWQSSATLGGIGSDFDILHSLGLGSLVTRPEPVNDAAGDSSTSHDFSVSAAIDSKGILHAVWRHIESAGMGGDWDIVHAQLQNGLWSAQELVNTNGSLDVGSDFYPRLAIDAKDQLHVVWYSFENVGGVIGTDPDILYARRTASGWSAPEVVNSFAGSETAPVNGDLYPVLAVEDDGVVHVAWLGRYTGGPDFGTHIYYARRAAGSWGSAEVVNAGAADVKSSNPDLALDGSTPHVVWASWSTYGGSGNDADIFYSQRSSGGWSPPQFVNVAANDSANDYSPQIVVFPNGNLQVVWSSDLDPPATGIDHDLFSALRAGGVWLTPELLLESGLSDSGSDVEPRLLLDPDGALHLTWSQSANLFYATVPPGTTLPAASPPLAVDGASFGVSGLASRHSAPVMGRYGELHFLWDTYDSLGSTIGTDYDILHTHTLIPIRIPIFEDGFESGDKSAWSKNVP